MTDAMEAISASKEIYYPSAEVIANSNVPDYLELRKNCLLYTSPSPRDRTRSRMPSSA